MKFGWLVGAAALVATHAEPAQAVVTILEHSVQNGTLAQLHPTTIFDGSQYLEISVDTFTPDIAPPFSTPPILSPSNQPLPEWQYGGPIITTVKLTTELPLTTARGEAFQANYYNDYYFSGGVLVGLGGDDNEGDIDDHRAGCGFPSSPFNCLPINPSGNTINITFLGQHRASWLCADGNFGGATKRCVEYWDWSNGFLLVGDLPIADIGTLPDLGTAFTLETTVTLLPEPETWAMLIVGLFGMGYILRRRQSRFSLAASMNQLT